MKSSTFHIIIITLLCSFVTNAYSQQTWTKEELDERCGNFVEPTGIDSLNVISYPTNFHCHYASFNHDGTLLGFFFTRQLALPLAKGVLIVDENGAIAKYFSGAAGIHFSPKENMLVTYNFIYNIDADSGHVFPKVSANISLKRPVWSIDGEHLYWYPWVSGSGNLDAELYRTTKTGAELTPIYTGCNKWQVSENEFLNMNTFFNTGEERGYSLCNINTGETKFIRTPEFDTVRAVYARSISPERDRLIADVQYNNKGRYEGGFVLGMLNLKTGSFKEVLPSQAFGAFYNPNWTPWGTILVTYVCRYDSSAVIWEIDTTGRFLRQLTDVSMVWNPTSITPEQALPHSLVVGAPYPNPGNSTASIPLTIEQSGWVEYTLYDALGRVVENVSSKEFFPNGNHTLNVDTGNLNKGIYYLVIQGAGNAPVTTPLVIQ